jgi:heme A synthase
MRWFPRFAVGALAYNLLVVAWGAFVRATGSGAGCGSHWPVCNGEVIPRSPAVATLIEFAHRATSGVALLSVAVLLAGAIRLYPRGHAVRRGAWLSVLLMITEALVGALLVLAGWVAKDRSAARGVVVPIHLVNTQLLLAAMAYTARSAMGAAPRLELRGRGTAGTLLLAALGLLLVLGMSGAVTALGDTLFPPGSLAEGLAQDRDPAAHVFLRLRIWHPTLAVVAALLVAGAAATSFLDSKRSKVKRLSLALGGLFALQLGAGLVNLVLLAPVWMQITHLLLADFTWLALVLLAVEQFDSSEPSAPPVAAAA